MGIWSIFGNIADTSKKVNSNLFLLILSAVMLAADYFDLIPYETGWIAVVICGVPIIINASYAFLKDYDIKADVLVAIAIVASVLIHDVFAAGTVALIMSFGSYLEKRTTSKAIEGIRALTQMKPVEADIQQEDGSFKTCPVSDVKVGDRIRVLAGGTVPVDGRIIEGHSSLDESVLTGEAVLSDKTVDDTVLGGSVSRFGSFIMIADTTAEDTSLEKMIRLVDSADAGRSKIVRAADRWATWIVIAALFFAMATYIVTADVIRSVTVLVVFCPCSYVLATPTSIMAAIGNLSRKGILVRTGDALERLSEVSVIAFDKTGTITEGDLSLKQAVSFCKGLESEDILRYAAAAESMSEHPIGRCIASSADISGMKVTDSSIIPGKGITATVDGRRVDIGNLQHLKDCDTIMDKYDILESTGYQTSGNVLVYIGIDGRFVGIVMLTDRIRDGSAKAIRELKKMDVESIMITGDSEVTAKCISKEVGIERCFSRCLPTDKLEIVRTEEDSGRHVCMIGDGINDVAALRASTVSVAMGMGRDAAIESSDIVLMKGGIRNMPYAYALSKRTKMTIDINLCMATFINIGALALAVLGILDPITGSLVHNIGSILVITMAAMLLKWKPKTYNVPDFDGHSDHIVCRPPAEA